jgi:3-phosphoshikimate 1-carboxyvinyltransferase
MRILVTPGSRLRGECTVPGDKSIAHRWLILASTARGRSSLQGLPSSLDVRSTARCIAMLQPSARPFLEVWSRKGSPAVQGAGSTWNAISEPTNEPALEIEGEGRASLVGPSEDLDCGNSGTTMRLLAGIASSIRSTCVFTGDDSLRARPMERVAEPLRAMGARVDTTDGHAPVLVRGGELHGIRFTPVVPSAQVKSAVLLAAMAAEGPTTVVEAAPTRDHTERALEALGAPIQRDDGITVHPFQHEGFSGSVPGDPSSAVFLAAAAMVTGSAITIHDVGLNPSRGHVWDVMRRMGATITIEVERTELGEPVGTISVDGGSAVRPVRVEASESPLVIDEIPALAGVAAHASGPSRFLGASELRVKESDRLRTVREGLLALGGQAADEGDDLVVLGGGLRGGRASSAGDHRIAMALTVAGLAADSDVVISEAEVAAVSFPGFARVLAGLGASVEEDW